MPLTKKQKNKQTNIKCMVESGWSSWLLAGFPSRRPRFNSRWGHQQKKKKI